MWKPEGMSVPASEGPLFDTDPREGRQALDDEMARRARTELKEFRALLKKEGPGAKKGKPRPPDSDRRRKLKKQRRKEKKRNKRDDAERESNHAVVHSNQPRSTPMAINDQISVASFSPEPPATNGKHCINQETIRSSSERVAPFFGVSSWSVSLCYPCRAKVLELEAKVEPRTAGILSGSVASFLPANLMVPLFLCLVLLVQASDPERGEDDKMAPTLMLSVVVGVFLACLTLMAFGHHLHVSGRHDLKLFGAIFGWTNATKQWTDRTSLPQCRVGGL